MTQYKLFINTHLPELANKYSNNIQSHFGDSGFDIYTPEDIEFLPGETKTVNLKIKCQMINVITDQDVSYYLYPRSSISKTPLRLANSVGIIDAGYRGDIMAALTYHPTIEHYREINTNGILDLQANKFILPAFSRIVQICSENLSSFKYELKDELSETQRGDNGFGSTGGLAI